MASSAWPKCVDFSQTGTKIGETTCVTGKVLKVSEGVRGTRFLDFCVEAASCPFTVVIFASDLRDVGDVSKLAGQDIEIHGKIKQYAGRAEIILRSVRQLRGNAANIPPLPREYDASKHGRYSGIAPKAHKTAKSKRHKPADEDTFTVPPDTPR